MNPNQTQIENGFDDWAQDTISSATNGYQTFFHATPVNFTRFADFQHFGSHEAAARRRDARPSLKHVFHEVWLAIKNPLSITDDQAGNNVGTLAGNAWKAGLFDRDTLDQVLMGIESTQRLYQQAADYPAAKWRYTMAPFAAELSKRGYDGLVYPNTVEGGLSYVPFRGDQIWWVPRADHEA